MSNSIGFLWLLLLSFGLQAQPAYFDYPITSVPIKNVELTDNFWLPKIKIIQDSTILYALDKCKTEGRMESFLIAGGKMKGKVRGKMPFDDTDLYKIIEGASYTLISKPNPPLDATLDSLIEIIKIGQEPDGYLTTWFTIDRMHPPATWVKPSMNRWESERMSHELYNSGHLFEAAAAHFRATGKRNFLDIALKNADLLVANFGPGKLMIPPGHEIVETGLIQLYQITKNARYLELSKFYMDQRGDSTTHKLFGEYSQDHISVAKQDQAVGHAVRAVYLYAGMTDVAAIYHDQAYLKAVHNIWENMVTKKMYLTGGIGARHSGEAFGENYELPNLTAYNETCAAIGDVYWNHRLFLLTGDSKYYDIIERSLYNGLISGISEDGRKFFYPNPLESDGKYLFNMGACSRQSWFDCSCCPTNLIRFIPSVPGLIYATDKSGLFVNLFISNQTSVLVQGSKIQISQQTGYPWDGKVEFTLMPEKKSTFTVNIRIPVWARNQVLRGHLYSYMGDSLSKITLKINRKEIKPVIRNGYAEITKEWNPNDKITLNLPMPVRRVTTDEKVVTNSHQVAFERGPIVYCAEEADNKDKMAISSLPDNAKLKMDSKNIFSGTVNVIKVTGITLQQPINQINTKAKTSDLTLIPYYLWSNRGAGKMKVWFPR
jgi:DUF1680 family protein